MYDTNVGSPQLPYGPTTDSYSKAHAVASSGPSYHIGSPSLSSALQDAYGSERLRSNNTRYGLLSSPTYGTQTRQQTQVLPVPELFNQPRFVGSIDDALHMPFDHSFLPNNLKDKLNFPDKKTLEKN